MRIALAILHADTARGGAERYTLQLANGLTQRGHDVSLLASSFAPTPPGVAQVHLASNAWTRVGRYQHFLRSLDEHLAQARYDIVHAMLPVRQCDIYHPHAGIAAEAIASGHLKYPTEPARTFSRIGNHLNRRRRRFAAVETELLSGPHPPVVLCLSDYIRRDLLRHHKLAEQNMVTLINGVDLSRFAPSPSDIRRELNIADDKLIALLVAQDFHRKGLAHAIRALAESRDDRLVLLVVGKDHPGPYMAIARAQRVRQQVIFVGPTSDPRPFYNAADFFILPTRHDPCSLVVLEALACGLPVISTRQNGACEVMVDGQHGRVLPDPDDEAALVEAIREMLEDQRRHAMRQACLQLRPSLSQETHLERLLDLYGSIIRCRSV